jgi:hypothetical protein
MLGNAIRIEDTTTREEMWRQIQHTFVIVHVHILLLRDDRDVRRDTEEKTESHQFDIVAFDAHRGLRITIRTRIRHRIRDRDIRYIGNDTGLYVAIHRIRIHQTEPRLDTIVENMFVTQRQRPLSIVTKSRDPHHHCGRIESRS